MEMLAELEKQAARLLFRLGGISNCRLLPGPADEHVLLLVDVLNPVHVVSKLGVSSHHSAFMGGLSPVPFGCLYRPAMLRNGPNPCGNQKSGVRLKFH